MYLIGAPSFLCTMYISYVLTFIGGMNDNILKLANILRKKKNDRIGYMCFDKHKL